MKSRRRAGARRGLILLALGIVVPAASPQAQHFQDVTSDAGLSYPYRPDNSYGYGPGAAFGDWDNDGDMDLYITRDSQGDLLFMNDGSGNFTNVTGSFVLDPNPGCGTGVAWGDVDRDGDLDLFVCNGQVENVFYKNLLVETGVPSLKNETGAFNLRETQVRASMGAAFVDFNLDGLLDLYVANYIQEQNYLYQMRSDGIYVEVAASKGVDNPGWSFMSIWTDVDLDGDQDLYVVNDFSSRFVPNALYRNNKVETGSATFTEITSLTGELAADKGMGMGVAVGDYNQDGLLDIYVTNYWSNDLYRNNGDGTYTKVAQQVGVDDNQIGWGTAFVDYDNDRDMDLMLVNGWIAGSAKPLLTPHYDLFYRNNGSGSYSDYSLNTNFNSPLQGRALALADIDMDGDMDAVVTCCSAIGTPIMPILYRNDGGNVRSWLGIRLFGVASNPQGFGARVEVTAGGQTMVQEVYGGSSYLAQSSPWLLFGLGSASRAGLVRVYWPSGTIDELTNVSARQYVSIVEGSGIVAVTLQSYEATYRDGRVEVAWQVHDDGEILGFSLDRRREDRTDFVTLAGPDELVAGLRERHVFTDAGVRPGFWYEYRLRAHRDDGRIEVLANRRVRIPAGLTTLAQNVPNPFNPETRIRYELARAGRIDLAVYDVSGRKVRTLVSRIAEGGAHEVTWDGTDDRGRALPSGIYLYRLRASGSIETRKMILMK